MSAGPALEPSIAIGYARQSKRRVRSPGVCRRRTRLGNAPPPLWSYGNRLVTTYIDFGPKSAKRISFLSDVEGADEEQFSKPRNAYTGGLFECRIAASRQGRGSRRKRLQSAWILFGKDVQLNSAQKSTNGRREIGVVIVCASRTSSDSQQIEWCEKTSDRGRPSRRLGR